MCPQPQTSSRPDNLLCGGTSTQRSDQPEDPAHRRPTEPTSYPSRQGQQGSVRPASPRLLDELREFWKLNRPSNYIFPGKTSDVPISSTTIQKALKVAVAKAGIKKPVTPHTLRHSWATGMLEAGVDLLTISKILGHASFVTTMIYLHVRRQHFDRTPSPIDWLPVRQCPKWAEPGQQQPPTAEKKDDDNPPNNKKPDQDSE